MSPRKVLRHIFKFQGFQASLATAWKGILYLFLYHRNMRIIFMLGITAFLLGVYFKLRGIELIALCVTITLVFMAEIFNTAIEMLMDMLTTKYHMRIKLIKDIAAGIVILACLNALAVGYALFGHRLIRLCFAANPAVTASNIERSQNILIE